ncbi:MAG: diacylglycerol kinase family protein [Actinomycetes bacterium]
MSQAPGPRPGPVRRIAAITSLAATAVFALYLVGGLLSDLLALLIGLVGLALLIAGGWAAITERTVRRLLGILVALIGVGAIVSSIVMANDGLAAFAQRLLFLIVAAAIAGACARVALIRDLHEDDVPADQRFAPTRPVLIYNEKSGGGKVGSFGLLELASKHGVETVGLHPGDDLAQLARDAVARGADCLGMAGGDGSQALVASVAIECGVPFVCIPAGTRNHFALDLGLDRDDPRKAMPAFREGALRRIDYATVGDRLFVNNASLGVYATIVQQDDYRDAKLETSRNLLPDLVGGTAEAFDLQFTAPDGSEVDDVFVILVSNNPYVIGPSLNSSQRPSLTTGQLGVLAAHARTGVNAVAVLAEATLHLNRGPKGLMQFQATEFEVRSHGGSAYCGVDGEALQLDTPLRFTIHPAGLTMLVPLDCAHGPKPEGGRALDVRALWDIANGRHSRP